jgi:L-fucose isomerase-like protein
LNSIRIKSFAYRGASESFHNKALAYLGSALAFSPSPDEHEPLRILYFLSGGSEKEALPYLDPSVFQLLIANSDSNAFASAMEVSAYSREKNFRNRLLCLDDEQDVITLKAYLKVFDGLHHLRAKRIGLVGTVSEWLVASTISPQTLDQKLGMELVQIPWEKAGDFRNYEADKRFLESYHTGRSFNIEEAGKIESLLKKLIDDHKMDALTVECFSLVQENHVTACLGLSFLNDLGIPAGCEGDLCSITGMMLAKWIIGEIPWMANVAGIENNEVLLAHCTAPTGLLSQFHVNTHYETGQGTAISGRFKEKEVSIFRINHKVDRIFMAKGKVVEKIYNKKACRTQLNVSLAHEDIIELKTNSLGNHHLVLPGDHMQELKAMSEVLNLT